MSDSGFAGRPVAIVQAIIDSIVESTVIQSFLTGFYTLLFFQALVPLVRQKKWYIVTALSALFITIIINLAAAWSILHSVVVIHNATRETMALDILTGPESAMQKMASGTLALSTTIADSFLVWRCYSLWHNSKLIAAVYLLVLLGEIAILPVYLTLSITLGPNFGLLDLYFAISFVTTLVSTGLILYRIIDVSRQGNNQISRYKYTIEVLVESGMLYTAIILICAVVHLIQVFGIETPAVIQAIEDFDAILVPITGIAPTLITARNAAARSRNDIKRDVEARESQPVSRLSFKRSAINNEDGAQTIQDDIWNSGNINQIRTV